MIGRMRRLAAALLLLTWSCAAPGQPETGTPVAAYFARLDRPDGGYGWDDEPTGHLTATHAAVATLKRLGAGIPRRKERAEFVRTHHPYKGPFAESKRHAAELRSFVWQQIDALQLLGEDAGGFVAEVSTWTKPSSYLTGYEKAGNPLFQQEAMILLCRERLGLPASALSPALVSYFDARRRADGSFNNTPASDGSGGHVVNTLWGLEALRILGRLDERRTETIAWLRACQLPDGGFTWQPKAPLANVAGMDSTWAAATALALLGSAPADPDAAVRHILSAWNADGGFGPRPGRPSDPVSTRRAVEALAALKALDRLASASPRAAAPAETLPDGLRAFTIQLQAPGAGSPEEAVELARALKIHLWGAKNAKPGWIAKAQEIAARKRVPVTFFVADEEYGTYVSLPGFGTYSHVADLMAPAGVDFGPSMAGKDPDWERFRRERVAPLDRAGGGLVWQICDNEEFAQVLLDDSLERGGYTSIGTFHMRQNFVDILPFVMRYRGAIPFVTLQDAHGLESWSWADDLAGFRTIFLAKEPTWQGWREALTRDWVVSARHDETTRWRTRTIGGTPAALARIRGLEPGWRWWGERTGDLLRPQISLIVVRPGDVFEAGAPEAGVALRVRTGWTNSPQAALLKPHAEFAGLTLDGRPVETRPVQIKDAKGAVLDAYRIVELRDLAPGAHVAVATATRVGDGSAVEARVEFVAP